MEMRDNRVFCSRCMYRGDGDEPDCETCPATKSVGQDTWDLPGIVEYVKFKCRERNRDVRCPFFKARAPGGMIAFPTVAGTIK